ncbi:DUF58 domain-containing protein [Blastopirellula sp. JC732]|uniref:DUF58 domain-containing protein n=1 Tax=Blastopirellula sediminis TaxID=2894196 RepID=A0A9X1MJR3_9BACT|nr:DUF58 domain-containing protein [Blastopirellula sediminis]MCC9608850.1 DUF58 domain-containing protein [Blastopirellula sediminis]MCC9628373.1 DUF58 domain-containing protein [Blastopirellula sediminis]
MRWFVGAILILIISSLFGLSLLVYSMYALLAVMIASRLLTRYWSRHLSITRSVNRLEVEEGDAIAVNVTVTNTGALPIPWLLVEDTLPRRATLHRPPALETSGDRITLASLGPRKSKSFYYQLRCNRRGYFPIGPAMLETGDLFGLYRLFRVLAPPDYLQVLPKVIPLDGFDIASRRPMGEIKMTHRLFEDPTRIAGVRAYQAGDPINRVNWSATARTGVLHSKVYEPSSIAGATIVLDFHKDSFAPQHEPIRSEMAISLAVAIAGAVQETGQQVGLVTNARDAAERIKRETLVTEVKSRAEARSVANVEKNNDHLVPQLVQTRRGNEQMALIRKMLARAEMTDGLTMSQLITETVSRIPRDATVIAVLTETTVETALALGNLRRAGYTVTAIINIFDEYEFAQAAGKLLAEGIRCRQLNNLENISTICQEQAFSWF